MHQYASVQNQVTSEHLKIVTEFWLQGKPPDSAITPGSILQVQYE